MMVEIVAYPHVNRLHFRGRCLSIAEIRPLEERFRKFYRPVRRRDANDSRRERSATRLRSVNGSVRDVEFEMSIQKLSFK